MLGWRCGDCPTPYWCSQRVRCAQTGAQRFEVKEPPEHNPGFRTHCERHSDRFTVVGTNVCRECLFTSRPAELPPCAPGGNASPRGFAMVAAAWAMEATNGAPVGLTWQVSLQHDLNETGVIDACGLPRSGTAHVSQLWSYVDRLYGALGRFPRALTPLSLMLWCVWDGEGMPAPKPNPPRWLRVELVPEVAPLANLAFLCGAAPPIGRWVLMDAATIDGVIPNCDTQWLESGIPF